MNTENSNSTPNTGFSYPAIRQIDWTDLKEVLSKGLDDFKDKPSHVVLLVIIYPIIGLTLAMLADGKNLMHLIFPLISGFALIGPLAAIGLYEMSRRREKGLDVSWKHAFDILHSPSIGAILILSALMLLIYLTWIICAQIIFWLTFGSDVPASIMEFAQQVITTPAGWTLVIVGCAVGFVFALMVLAISAVSFPMILDRDVSARTAVQTSVNAFLANPKAMAMWGIIVVILLGIGSLPFFLGLAVVMPVLGHATWHLYRKVVMR